MADVARSEGYEAHSVDYRGIDEPRTRVAKLVDLEVASAGEVIPFLNVPEIESPVEEIVATLLAWTWSRNCGL